MEMTSYFKGLLGRIEPPPDNVTLAKESHEEVRDSLAKDDEISKADPETFLSGSYARETAINGIKDVDIILVLALDCTITEPELTLSWVQASLQNYYSKVKKQGRSVNVINDKGFSLDIVPATPVTTRTGPLWIPDREAKTWVATDPKAQIEFSSQRNKDTEGYYVHLIKMLKYWRDRLTNESARPNSYIIETLISKCVTSKPSSYGDAAKNIFSCIHFAYQGHLTTGSVPAISDPAYSAVNVAKRWGFDEFSAFMTEVEDSYHVAKQALESEDQAQSVKLWRKLFGNKFSPKEE